MSEAKPVYAHGGPTEPTTCPTCGGAVSIEWRHPSQFANLGPISGPKIEPHYTPLTLDALERRVVEAAIGQHVAAKHYDRQPKNSMAETISFVDFKIAVDANARAVDALLAARAAETKGEG